MKINTIFFCSVGILLSIQVWSMSNESESYTGFAVVRLNSLVAKQKFNSSDISEFNRIMAILERSADRSVIKHYHELYAKKALTQMMGTDEESRPYIGH